MASPVSLRTSHYFISVWQNCICILSCTLLATSNVILLFRPLCNLTWHSAFYRHTDPRIGQKYEGLRNDVTPERKWYNLVTKRYIRKSTDNCYSVFQDDHLRWRPMHSTWHTVSRDCYIPPPNSLVGHLSYRNKCGAAEGTASVLLFHFKNRQVLQQPRPSCILAIFNTRVVCGRSYSKYITLHYN